MFLNIIIKERKRERKRERKKERKNERDIKITFGRHGGGMERLVAVEWSTLAASVENSG